MDVIKIDCQIAAELSIDEKDNLFLLSHETENTCCQSTTKSKKINLTDEEKIRKVLTKVEFWCTIVSYGTMAYQILRR